MTLWNQDEHATFVVNLGYMSIAEVEKWLARRDQEFGPDKLLGDLLVAEGAITQEQHDMLALLVSQPAGEFGGSPRDSGFYVEMKRAARQGDFDRAEELLEKIEDEDFRYLGEIQTLKAQHARDQEMEREEE